MYSNLLPFNLLVVAPNGFQTHRLSTTVIRRCNHSFLIGHVFLRLCMNHVKNISEYGLARRAADQEAVDSGLLD